MYRTQPDQVARLRAGVVDGRRGAALARAVARARDGGLDLGEPDLKRVPRGFDADHPRADLLRHRRVVLSRREAKLPGWLHRPEAAERIASWFDAATPTVTWLREHVGPSDAPPKRR
jgi:uncharacterized protein (DUF2461 family)